MAICPLMAVFGDEKSCGARKSYTSFCGGAAPPPVIRSSPATIPSSPPVFLARPSENIFRLAIVLFNGSALSASTCIDAYQCVPTQSGAPRNDRAATAHQLVGSSLFSRWMTSDHLSLAFAGQTTGTYIDLGTISLCEAIDLPSRRSERVLNSHLGMFTARISRRCVIHHDVSVRWNGEPDVDLEASAVTVFMTGSDDRDAASGDTVIVSFQTFNLLGDHRSRTIRRFRTFEGDLWRDFHIALSRRNGSFEQSIRPNDASINRPVGDLERINCNTLQHEFVLLRSC
jgi:hypothetical protein